MTRLAALLLLAGMVLSGMTFALARPAYAEGLSDLCKTAPAPVRPDYQVAGMVMEKPDLSKVPDVAPNPFADPKIPISDVYGWAWRWTNYDLGCGNDFIRDPNAVVNTGAANFLLSGVDAVGAAIQSLEHMARDLDVGWLVTVLKAAADKLSPVVLGIGLPLGVIVVGLLVALASMRAAYDETLRRVLIVVGCVAAAVFTLVFPATAATKVDAAARSVADVSQSGFSTQASDLIVRNSLYPTWLAGSFGSADSPIAKEYGPRLLDATTYSWSDVKNMDADPAARQRITAAKNAEFKKIATEVQKKDPAAYAAMTGKDDTRTSAAVLGAVWVAIMGFFVAVAGLIMVLGRLIMMAMVIATPLATVVGVVNFGVLQRLWDLFAAGVINIAKFTVAAGVVTLLLGGIQAAPVGVGWKLLLTIALTVVAVMLTKPVRSFKSMAGLNPDDSRLGGLLKRAGAGGLGFVMGREASARDRQQPEPMAAAAERPTGATTTYARQQPVESQMPALPPPPRMYAVGQAPSVSQLSAVEAPGTKSTSGWGGVEAFAVSGGRHPRAALTATADPARPAAPQLDPRVSRRLEPEVAPPRFVKPQGAVSPNRTADPQAVMSPNRIAEPQAVVSPNRTVNRPTTAIAAGAQPEAAVYPTGIIVSANPATTREATLYRRGRDTEELYLRLPEPDLNASAEEVTGATYRSVKTRAQHPYDRGLVDASTH
ncbi:MAG TPA: hypothetical protein VF635_07620 [Propionibacteriaceae bacterium]